MLGWYLGCLQALRALPRAEIGHGELLGDSDYEDFGKIETGHVTRRAVVVISIALIGG